MGWSADETRSFVKLYLNHKCLWNIEDDDYKYKHKKTEAYQDISEKFHALYNVKLSETGVRVKINNLRSTYVQYLRKVRREQRSIESFSSLKWMKDIHECFSSISIPRNLYIEGVHYDDKNEAETNSEDPSQHNIWLPDDTVEESDDQKNSNISPITDDECVSLTKDESGDTEIDKVPYKRKRKHKWSKSNSLGGSSSDQSRDIKVKKPMDIEDEYDIYGKYIASQLRELGLQRALKVKLQIHNIVSEARLDSLSD